MFWVLTMIMVLVVAMAHVKYLSSMMDYSVLAVVSG